MQACTGAPFPALRFTLRHRSLGLPSDTIQTRVANLAKKRDKQRAVEHNECVLSNVCFLPIRGAGPFIVAGCCKNHFSHQTRCWVPARMTVRCPTGSDVGALKHRHERSSVHSEDCAVRCYSRQQPCHAHQGWRDSTSLNVCHGNTADRAQALGLICDSLQLINQIP